MKIYIIIKHSKNRSYIWGVFNTESYAVKYLQDYLDDPSNLMGNYVRFTPFSWWSESDDKDYFKIEVNDVREEPK